MHVPFAILICLISNVLLRRCNPSICIIVNVNRGGCYDALIHTICLSKHYAKFMYECNSYHWINMHYMFVGVLCYMIDNCWKFLNVWLFLYQFDVQRLVSSINGVLASGLNFSHLGTYQHYHSLWLMNILKAQMIAVFFLLIACYKLCLKPCIASSTSNESSL